MADYIEDIGGDNLHALLSGTYVTQPVGNSVRLGADGEADSTFTLPTDSDWLMVETFNVDGVATDIGYTKWQSDVSQIVTDIQAIWTLVSGTSVSTFGMVATHYKSATGVVDVYRTDETGNFAGTPTDTDLDFTFPTGTWSITDTVLAPDDSTSTLPIAIHKWAFDGTSVDTGSTGGLDGVDTGVTYTTTDAKFDQAVNFPSTTSYIDHGYTAVPGVQFSVSFYFVFDELSTGTKYLFGTQLYCGLFTEEFNSDGLGYVVAMNNNSGEETSRATAAYVLGQMYHIGANFEYESSTPPELYIDGVLQDTRHDGIVNFSTNRQFGFTCDGTMDHFELFDRHLTAAEMLELSNRTSV